MPPPRPDHCLLIYHRSLESLTLQGNDFIIYHSRPIFISLSVALRNMRGCTILRLIDNKFKDGEMNLILKELIKNYRIKTFQLTNVKYSDDLADFITENEGVDDFMLSLVEPNESNMERIMRALVNNHSLIHIDMPFMSRYRQTIIRSITTRNIQIKNTKQ